MRFLPSKKHAGGTVRFPSPHLGTPSTHPHTSNTAKKRLFQNTRKLSHFFRHHSAGMNIGSNKRMTKCKNKQTKKRTAKQPPIDTQPTQKNGCNQTAKLSLRHVSFLFLFSFLVNAGITALNTFSFSFFH